MDTYSILREFADSWMLLAMFTFFIGVAIWAFLPSQREAREDASMIPFRHDTPAPDIESAAGCKKDCATCACKELEGK